MTTTPYCGQKNYPQHIGTSKTETIAQVGCLLTAFCNLLYVADKLNIDPPTLNAFLVAHGGFIDGDLLGWQSINNNRPFRVVVHNGSVPIPQWSIVRMQASFGTHFSLVHSIVNRVVNIVDSWDGMIKPSSAYGKIDQWASYTPIKPQLIKPYKE